MFLKPIQISLIETNVTLKTKSFFIPLEGAYMQNRDCKRKLGIATKFAFLTERHENQFPYLNNLYYFDNDSCKWVHIL